MSNVLTSLAAFWSELRRRRVFRVAAGYGFIGWVLVEVAATTFPLLGLPGWTPTLVLVLLLLGFPVALVMAWALELTPDGVRREQPAAAGPRPPIRSMPRLLPLAGIGAAVLLGVAAYVGLGSVPAGEQGTDEARIASIAVLPFADMSPDGDQAHFGHGVAEELLDALARVPGLRVTARTSSFQFRDAGVDVREVGRHLNVQAVIEGSIRKYGNQVRVTAQLVSTVDGYHLWSGRYDRALTDVFAIQDEISRAILLSLRPKLVGESAAALSRVPTGNLEAYELFLKANHALTTAMTAEDMRSVIAGLERAVELDPRFALAYAALSEAYQELAWLVPPAEPMARAERAALRALELDDQLAEGYATLANLRHTQWEWDTATDLYHRSIALNPTLSAACKCYGFHLLLLQQQEAALRELERARALDPVSSLSHTFLAMAYYSMGRIPDARAEIDRALSLNPHDPRTHVVAAWVDWAQGRYDDALERLVPGASPSALGPGNVHPYVLAEVGFTLGRAGRRTEARELLRRLEAHAAAAHISPVWIAAIYAGLDDTANAMSWLQRAHRERSVELTVLIVGGMSEPLRELPAYRELLRQIGLDRLSQATR